MEQLDPVLHQPVRTQMAAYLAGAGEATFSELKQQLAVSDGNLDSHLKKMLAAGYITVRKELGAGRPQTCFALSETGQSALQAYVLALQQLLAVVEEPQPARGGKVQNKLQPA